MNRMEKKIHMTEYLYFPQRLFQHLNKRKKKKRKSAFFGVEKSNDMYRTPKHKISLHFLAHLL
jgi:hypothetical protein